MHDQKNMPHTAAKENMPIPGKVRGGSSSLAMNNQFVAIRRDIQTMSKSISGSIELNLQISKIVVENMQALARVEQKLDAMAAAYDGLITKNNLVPRPTSDGGLSFIDVQHEDQNGSESHTPLCTSHTETPSIVDDSAVGSAVGSSDTGSLISMSAYKVDPHEEPAVDGCSMPPGVQEPVNEDYFAGKPAEEVVQEVVEEEIVDEELSRKPVDTQTSEKVSIETQDIPLESAETTVETQDVSSDTPAIYLSRATVNEMALLAEKPGDDEDVDKLVAELANTSDADLSAFTAPVEPPKPVKKTRSTAKPKSDTPKMPRKRATKKAL